MEIQHFDPTESSTYRKHVIVEKPTHFLQTSFLFHESGTPCQVQTVRFYYSVSQCKCIAYLANSIDIYTYSTHMLIYSVLQKYGRLISTF